MICPSVQLSFLLNRWGFYLYLKDCEHYWFFPAHRVAPSCRDESPNTWGLEGRAEFTFSSLLVSAGHFNLFIKHPSVCGSLIPSVRKDTAGRTSPEPGERPHSVAVSECSASRGFAFSSQHPCQVTHHCLKLQLQGILWLRLLRGATLTCTNPHTL